LLRLLVLLLVARRWEQVSPLLALMLVLAPVVVVVSSLVRIEHTTRP
jgi:hypothetical protein